MVSIKKYNVQIKFSKVFFIAFIACLFVRYTIAQDRSIAFTSLTSKDGLSSNSINAIIKDRYGLMWFATDDGLNKFDGTNFTVYRQELNDPTTLRSNRVTTLFEDQTGNLWIGTDGGGVSIYNRAKDNFSNLDFPDINNSVTKILADAFGRIWIAHYSGLTVIEPKKRKHLTFRANTSKRGQLSTNTILTVFQDKRNVLWVGTTDGLFRFNRKTREFIAYNMTRCFLPAWGTIT